MTAIDNHLSVAADMLAGRSGTIRPAASSSFGTQLDSATSSSTFVDNGPGGSGQTFQLDSRGHIVCMCPSCVAARAAATSAASSNNASAASAATAADPTLPVLKMRTDRSAIDITLWSSATSGTSSSSSRSHHAV